VSNGYDSKITSDELERTGEEAVMGYLNVPSQNLAAVTINTVITPAKNTSLNNYCFSQVPSTAAA
jgi:hypothetical protein